MFFAFLFAAALLLIPMQARSALFDTLDKETVQWMQSRVLPYVVITIPGSGTHLLEKALFYLNHSIPRWHFNQPNRVTFCYMLDPNHPNYLLTHFWMVPQMETLHRALQLKKIICIRDLRDVCVTILHKMREGSWPGFNWYPSHTREAFLELSNDEQLHFVLNYEYNAADIGEIRQFSLPLVVSQAIEYMKDPDVVIIRYEDLVGEKGNGTKVAQIKELKRLAEAIEVSVTEESLEEIADQLFGDHPDQEKRLKLADPQITFRKGKTGSWKDVFKEEHKEAFKQKFGDALIEMGYEKNQEW